MIDKKYMKMALELAARSTGFTSPNPAVGAVVVKNNRVISSAFHRRAGLPHAEASALRKAGKEARGARLYVNLEPCVHFGRTPPCCDAIIKSGIKETVIAVKDSNPLNNGKGIRKLKKAGIKVITGMFKEEAADLNKTFFKFITKRMPYIFIKVAQSLDGKIATRTGDSKWITSKNSRYYVQKLRQQVDGLLVGVKTIIRDNPHLTCRLKKKKIMTKIIIDPNLRTPPRAKIFKQAKKVIIVTKRTNKFRPEKKILEKKAEIIEVNCHKNGSLNLRQALKEIAKHDIVSLMVEGGGETISSFIREGLADEMFLFIAPKIIGGRCAPTSVEGNGVTRVKDALCFEKFEFEKVGRDLLLKLKY